MVGVLIVSPDSVTTLFFNRQTYLPFMVGTARAAFKNLVNGKAIGIGPEGIHYSFKDVLEENILTFPDQPLLRSAHRAWVIPTMITIDPHRFFSHGKRGDNKMPSVRTVYEHFKGFCQYCGLKIRWNDINRSESASREHLWATSLGGPSTRENLLLTHARCNALLGNRADKRDINGNPLPPGMKPSPAHYTLPRGVKARPEWLRICPWLEKPVELDLT